MFAKICALTLLTICGAAPAAARAQLSTTPGYTHDDQQQFAKLRVLVGTWKCADIPATKKPDVQTAHQSGNYFVVRETGDEPNTEYIRWSHSYKMYYLVELNDDGGSVVMSTKSLDPMNATWIASFPARMADEKPYYGRPFFPMYIALSGDTLTYTTHYYGDNGSVRLSKSVCTRVR